MSPKSALSPKTVDAVAKVQNYEVEFLDHEGDTVALLTVSAEDLRRATTGDLKNEPWPEPLPAGVEAPIADATRPSSQK